jgi:hypothetical protein
MTDNQLIQLEDQAWLLYCRLGSAFEHSIFSESAARRGKTVPISNQTLSEYQKRLSSACRRAYARYQRRSDALM